MPVLSIVTPEVEQNIIRPIVLDVVRQVFEYTGIPSSTPVIYTGRADGAWQPGSTLFPTDPNIMASQENVRIEVEEEFEDEFFAAQVTNRPSELLDFLDEKLGIEIKPAYKQSKFSINFTYETPNRGEALAWRNRAQNMVANTHQAPLHEAEYHYFYSDKVWELLHHLYELRENVAGYGVTWDQYVQEHITTRAVMVAAQDGKQLLAFREKQMRIQGEFDFRAEPEKENKNSDKSNWSISFSYTFLAARPEIISVRFPVSVHNQLVDERFIPKQVVDHEAFVGRAGGVTSVLHHFEAVTQQRNLMRNAIAARWPSYDEWIPDTPVPHARMAASFIVSLDPSSDLLVNLRDMGEFQLDSDVLEFIAKAEHSWVNKLYCSPIQIAVYRNGSLLAHDCFEVTADLDVNLKIEKDLRSVYRIWIGFSNDITKIDYRSIKRMVRFPKAACKLFKATDTNMGRLNAYMQHIDVGLYAGCVRPGGYTRQEVIDSIVWQKTVMNFYPDAWRREDLEARALKGYK